jgi:hypothetical protein
MVMGSCVRDLTLQTVETPLVSSAALLFVVFLNSVTADVVIGFDALSAQCRTSAATL